MTDTCHEVFGGGGPNRTRDGVVGIGRFPSEQVSSHNRKNLLLSASHPTPSPTGRSHVASYLYYKWSRTGPRRCFVASRKSARRDATANWRRPPVHGKKKKKTISFLFFFLFQHLFTTVVATLHAVYIVH